MSQTEIDKTAIEIKQYLTTQVGKMQKALDLVSGDAANTTITVQCLKNDLWDMLRRVDSLLGVDITNNPAFVKAFINRRAAVLGRVVMKNIVAFNYSSVGTENIAYYHCIDVHGREFFAAIRADVQNAVWYCIIEKGSTKLTWAYYTSHNFVDTKDFDFDWIDFEETTEVQIAVNEFYELGAVLDVQAMISLFE